MTLPPSGPLSVGAQDLYYHKAGCELGGDNHVVGRMFYPTSAKGPWLRPRWLKAYHYGWGNVLFVMFYAKTMTQRIVRRMLASMVYLIGMSFPVDVQFNTPVDGQHGPYPVIIYSHGASSMRNTFSSFCKEFASRGFVVLALEHADGTACSAQLADGSIKVFSGVGPRTREKQNLYRVAECCTAVNVLKALHQGSDMDGTVRLSGSTAAAEAFKGCLDMSKVALIGHSCGGATVAEAVSTHPCFNCGVAFDPWWPMLPSDGCSLNGWKTATPLLVMGSQTWNTPDALNGDLPCDGKRQRRVLEVARSSGCEFIHFVPKGTNHHTYSDLPMLGTSPVVKGVAKMMNIKTTDLQPAAAMALLGSAVQMFLDAKLPLGPNDAPGRVARAFAHKQQAQLHKLQQDAEREEKPHNPEAAVDVNVNCSPKGGMADGQADGAVPSHQEFAQQFKQCFEPHASILTTC